MEETSVLCALFDFSYESNQQALSIVFQTISTREQVIIKRRIGMVATWTFDESERYTTKDACRVFKLSREALLEFEKKVSELLLQHGAVPRRKG